MHDTSPPESVHALGIDALRHPSLSVWTAWIDGELAGVGALKALDADRGEIKSMRTAEAFLRQGVAAHMLDHIIAIARERGLERLSLETGSSGALSLIHISEPTRRLRGSRMPSSA